MVNSCNDQDMIIYNSAKLLCILAKESLFGAHQMMPGKSFQFVIKTEMNSESLLLTMIRISVAQATHMGQQPSANQKI